MFWPGFQKWQFANHSERIVFEHAEPAVVSDALLGLSEFLERNRPRPFRSLGIGCGQVGPGDVEIQLRLPDGLVPGGEEGHGFGAGHR